MLGNLKIKTRIALGFGALVFLGAGPAIFGAWQLSEIDGQVDTMGAAAETTARVLETGRQLETMRRAEMRYRTNPDEATLADATRSAAQTIDLLKASAEGTASDERRTLYAGVLE